MCYAGTWTLWDQHPINRMPALGAPHTIDVGPLSMHGYLNKSAEAVRALATDLQEKIRSRRGTCRLIPYPFFWFPHFEVRILKP